MLVRRVARRSKQLGALLGTAGFSIMMGRVEALVDEDMRRDSPKRVPIARGLVALALLLVSGLAEAEAEAVAVLEAQDRLSLADGALSRLRKKLEGLGEARLIVAVRGEGYRFGAPLVRRGSPS